jgi:RNA polymerase sigma-70 factor (ECF subfamily)
MLDFQRGDDKAFDQIFTKYSVSLVNFVYRFLGSRAKAEEVAQEVLLRVYRARQSYRPRAKFSTWIYRVAKNFCLNELRRHEYVKPPVSIDDPDDNRQGRLRQWTDEGSPTPEDDLVATLFEKAFNRAVGALPARQRAAFVMTRFTDLSYRDAAVALGCTETTVKSLVHRANTALKESLKDYIIDDRG